MALSSCSCWRGSVMTPLWLHSAAGAALLALLTDESLISVKKITHTKAFVYIAHFTEDLERQREFS